MSGFTHRRGDGMSRLGLGRWVAVDPTIPGDFVDATHIAVSVGGVPQIWDLAPYGRELKVEVLDDGS